MKNSAAALLLALGLSLTLCAAQPPPVVIVGEVVDTTCYLLHDGKGSDHYDCAVTCVKAGTPAAILDDKTKKLIFPLAPENEAHHGKRPDEALMPYVGKRVRVTGRTVERGGVTAIVIDKVEPAG